MNGIMIKDKKIGMGYKPFIIAEMSANHNQSLEQALAIVEAAAKTGVDALKLQTYTPDTMTINLSSNEFLISNQESLWYGYSLYDLYKVAHTPWEWHKPIFDRCEQLGLICFSTPFDGTAIDFLEDLNTPCYKIASFEVTDLPLIRKAAATGKPLIISTGMATIAEIDDAVTAARHAGCNNLILLKCTSTYPASPEDSNLLTISHMRDLFDCQVGLSDHTLGIGAAIASVALGAVAIEKHFSLSRSDGGVDSAFSLEPHEMQALVAETEIAAKALGRVSYGAVSKETSSLLFRRSLYVVKDVEQGEVFTENNLKAIRPGLGLPPKYLDKFLGKKASCNIKVGTPLSWNCID